jgi:hypothetical protein
MAALVLTMTEPAPPAYDATAKQKSQAKLIPANHSKSTSISMTMNFSLIKFSA